MREVEPAGRVAAVIPAYKPSDALVELVRALAEGSFAEIVVVDDGSGPEFCATFERVAAFPKVILLRHAVNLGKGAALKTGINHALCSIPNLAGVVTGDADGQHHVEDIERVACRLRADPDSLVLGCRTFQGEVPLRSRFGNTLTRGVMHVLMGRKLTDTQTGLRGIPSSFARRILELEADGYEFEMEMLLMAHQISIPVVEEPIRTIYEAGNQSSHFNPIVDSMKIYFVLLRFGSVSLMTALLDGLIFYLAYRRTGNVLASQVLARLFSLTFNYSLVRSSVFYSHQRHEKVLPKYLLLVLASGTMSYGGIRLFSDGLGMNPVLAKVTAETILFFLNFAAQRLLIFKPETPSASSEPTPEARLEPTSNPRLVALVSIVVAAALGLEAYGFATGNLFSELAWDDLGLHRFTRFLYSFGGVALALVATVPWILAPLAVAFTALGTALAVGPQALVAVVFFLVSCGALGSRLLGRHRDETGDRPESQIFATLLGIAVYILLMTFLVRLPVNYPAVWGGLVAIPILADLRGTGRRLARWWHALRPSVPLTSAEAAALAVLIFFLLTHWFAATMPEHSGDGMAMHLAIPMNIDAHHRMTYEPDLFVWAVMPMAADFAYAISFLLGGEYAAHLLDFSMLLLIEGLLYCVMRRWVSRTTAFLLMALFATTPLVQLVTGSLFVENFQAALVLGMMAAIWRFGEDGEKRYLYLAAALGGTAMATKFGTLAFVALAAPFAVREVVRHWKSLGRKPAFVCLLATVLLLGTAAPTYAIAYVKTGNPLFPFLSDKFLSPLIAPGWVADDRFKLPLNLKTLYDLTFHTGKAYEGQDGSFGFQYLALVPLALVAILFLRRRPAVSAAAVGLGAAILIMVTQPNARYLYACLPLVTVAFAAVLAWAADRPWLFHALTGFVLAAIVANAYFLPSSSYHHKDFSLRRPFSRADHDRYLTQNVPARAVIAYFNRAHPGAPVLLTGYADLAGIEGPVYENSWHQYKTLNAIRHARSVASMVELMRSLKVEYFISPKPESGYEITPPPLRDMLALCTEREFEDGDRYLGHLLPTCKEPPPHRTTVLGPGGYDDVDDRIEFTGDWYADRQFAQPWGHTVTYCGDPSCSVRVTFKGTAITYVYTGAANRGIAQVLIDGQQQARVDLYSKEPKWQSVRRFGDLPLGVHIFEVRVTGEKDPLSSGTVVDLDAAVIE